MGNSSASKIKAAFEAEYRRSSNTHRSGRKKAFSLHAVYGAIVSEPCASSYLASLSQRAQPAFSSSKAARNFARNIALGCLRFSMLCQPVKDDCTSTVFQLRWQLKSDDSRYASFRECFRILLHLLSKLSKESASTTGVSDLALYIRYGGCPYDVPVDYCAMTRPRIHLLENIRIVPPREYSATLKKRVSLQGSLKRELPKRILNKIAVSSYKTERSMTGAFKTNREYRWETVSKSEQGATKQACWGVELKLLEQVAKMANSPIKAIGDLSYLNDLPTTLCPVTLAPLDYMVLKSEGAKSTHGESLLQLGHLQPKSTTAGAHNDSNISWMSSEGNRIQGTESVDAIHSKILEIASRITKSKR